MNIKQILTIAFCSVVLAGCDTVTNKDTFPEGYIIFENKSSHKIEITREETMPYLEIHIPKCFEIAPQKSIRLNTMTASIYPLFTKVVFDSTVEMIFSLDIDSQYNITNGLNYATVLEDPCIWYYTYTFTDADYQFALENGTVLE